jgi:hypothetical protein
MTLSPVGSPTASRTAEARVDSRRADMDGDRSIMCRVVEELARSVNAMGAMMIVRIKNIQ